MKKFLVIGSLLLTLPSCSPLRSSPNDEKHQLELTLHEVQTNLDDLRHDINCYQTEQQILEGRIKYFENTLSALKQNDLENQQSKIEYLTQSLLSLEKRIANFDKLQSKESKALDELSSHANETSASLSQFKDRISELEQELFSQNKKLETVGKLKGDSDSLHVKIYRVKAGDSLEKIARAHKTAVEKIKKLNDLDQDLIVIGQELKIPLQ